MNRLKAIDNFLKLNPTTGRYNPVEWRRYILPAFKYFTLSDVQGIFTIEAAGTPTRLVSYVQQYSSVNGRDQGLGTPFEVKQLLFEDSTDGTASAAFTVMLKEMGESRLFMNFPVHVRTLCGTGQYPARLREPYMFFSSHNIQAQFNKITGGATTMRMYLGGAEYFPWAVPQDNNREKIISILKQWKERQKYVWPYWLTPDENVSLAANAEANFDIKVGEDGHFEVFTIQAVSTGNFEYEISEVKTGAMLSNGRATKTNSLGDARLPTILPESYLIRAGYRINIKIKDLSGATNNIYFTMAGRRINAPLKDIPDLPCAPGAEE